MKIAPLQNFNSFSSYNKSGKKSFITQVPEFSRPYFTSASLPVNNRLKESSDCIKAELSKTFQIDRNYINKHYFGNISDKNKFSKYGYYALISKNNPNVNIRQLNKNYENLYQKNLKSLYDVGSGIKEYSNITLKNNKLVNSWFEYLNVSDIAELNSKIREEYQNGTLDNLLKYSIQNNFTENFKKPPIHKVNLNDVDFEENILFLDKEKIRDIFTVINDYIDNSSQNEYSEIYKLLDDFADSIYSQNETKITASYQKIINVIEPFYKNNHKKKEFEETKLIQDFLKSENYKSLNQNYNLDLLFKTNILSNDEKTFLINKKDEDYGIDLYKFLIDSPTNNKIRKQIINNLILSENADKQAFKLMKKIFIKEINSGNGENIDSKLLDSVIFQINKHDGLNLISNEDKIKYLKRFPEEEINILLENLKTDWLRQRQEEAFEIEAAKYDINYQADKLTADITTKIDDTKAALSDMLNELTEQLSEQINTTQNTLGDLVVRHDKNMVRQLLNQNRQMEQITKILCSNTQESKEIQKQISLILDKIEANHPNKKKETDRCRTVLRQLTGLTSMGIGIGRLITTKGTDLGGLFNIIYGLNTILL